MISKFLSRVAGEEYVISPSSFICTTYITRSNSEDIVPSYNVTHIPSKALLQMYEWKTQRYSKVLTFLDLEHSKVMLIRNNTSYEIVYK